MSISLPCVGDIVRYKKRPNMVAQTPVRPGDIGVVEESRGDVLFFVNFPTQGVYAFLPEFIEVVGRVECQ